MKLHKKLSRNKLLEFLAQLPACLIGMEACSGAHYWGREIRRLGHEVRLIPPQYVKPYVKTNKNDYNDAEAICEAVSRPQMRFVSIKSIEHQDIQSVHRVREHLVKERTALVNQVRGLLSEYGLIVGQGVHTLRRALPRLLEDAENGLTALGRELFLGLYERLVDLDKRMAEHEAKISEVFATHPLCQRLAKVEGIGPLTATAMVAGVADPTAFKNGRQLAAWLGLVPRQHSSGGKTVLLGISKRGDRYLRTLLVHGARAVLYRVEGKEDARSRWLQGLKHRRGINRACVALANKNARILWALMARGDTYRPALAS